MNSEIFHLPLTELGPSEPKEVLEGTSGVPVTYGENRLVALPRDPLHLWLYWELQNGAGDGEIRLYYAKDRRLAMKTVCRIEFANYYIQAPESGCTYYAELGSLDARRHWLPLLRSNDVTLPYGYPANEVASRAMFRTGTVSSAISSIRAVSSKYISSMRFVSSIRWISSAMFSRRPAVYSRRPAYYSRRSS